MLKLCASEQKQSDFRGTVSTTISGKTCQKWTVQAPNSHSHTPSNYPDKGLGDHNYCRNPDGKPHAWWYAAASYLIARAR